MNHFSAFAGIALLTYQHQTSALASAQCLTEAFTTGLSAYKLDTA